MKTLQEITLYFYRDPHKPILTYKVKVKKTFEMFGETFAAHRLVKYYWDGFVETNKWRVSEVKTGVFITEPCRTQKEAIESAKEILEIAGEEKVKKAKSLTIEKLKSKGIEP